MIYGINFRDRTLFVRISRINSLGTFISLTETDSKKSTFTELQRDPSFIFMLEKNNQIKYFLKGVSAQ